MSKAKKALGAIIRQMIADGAPAETLISALLSLATEIKFLTNGRSSHSKEDLRDALERAVAETAETQHSFEEYESVLRESESHEPSEN